jgi:4-hydroxybenzoate polyprenyltransferase
MANLSSEIKKSETLNPIATAIALIETARPVHWIKNLAIFAPLVFAGDLYVRTLFIKVFWAFIAFDLATSATYIFNDILDAKADALHPIKKFRPIAAGKLPIPLALAASVGLALVSINLAADLNSLFFFMITGYLIMQILYSLGLKNLAIIDILLIAAGFIIRVYAGAFVIDAHLSVWFLLCVISTALFLASGKRRAELGVISAAIGETRKSLAIYSKPLLDSYVTMFGNAAWLSWALFTFFESPRLNLPVWLFLAEISRTTTVNKLLMITIPVVIFGIMRYESLIFKDKAEAPEKVLLTDKALITSVIIWISLVVWIIYSGISNVG